MHVDGIHYAFRDAYLGVVQLCLGLIYIFESLLIVFWIKRQERAAKEKLDSEAVKSVIFPIFVYLLWINVAVNVYSFIILLILPSPDVHESKPGIKILYSISFGLQRFVVEGLTFLLMQKGMGINSGKKSFRFAGWWAFLSAVVGFLSFTQDYGVGFALKLIWNFILIIFYLIVWKAPSHRLFRRPAVLQYAPFWIFYQSLSVVFSILRYIQSTAAVGACGEAFGVQFLFAICEPWLVYRTLCLDCGWWQGVVMDRLSTTKTKKPFMNTSKTFSNDIATPLIGVDINLESAQSLANTVDQMVTERGVKLLNFAYIKLDESKMLGQGSFSNVYRGSYRNRECAIKLIYTTDLTTDTIRRVAAEAEILSSIKSPNIVEMYGVSVLPPSVCILLELCKYGSLGDILRGKQSNVAKHLVTGKLAFCHADLVHLALGCARGIAALHRMKGVCHRDVKSFNFLVDWQLNVKVADLELGVSESAVDGFIKRRKGTIRGANAPKSTICCCFGENAVAVEETVRSSIVEIRQSIRQSVRQSLGVALGNISPIEEAENILANWCSPEFLISENYTQESDIYSLGVVFWEIISRNIPFDKTSRDQEGLRQLIIEGARPKIPASCDADFAVLIRKMWQPEKSKRPTANDIVEYLERMWLSTCYDRVWEFRFSGKESNFLDLAQKEEESRPTISVQRTDANSENFDLVDGAAIVDEVIQVDLVIEKEKSSFLHSTIPFVTLVSFDSECSYWSRFEDENCMWAAFSGVTSGLLYSNKSWSNEFSVPGQDPGTTDVWSYFNCDITDTQNIMMFNEFRKSLTSAIPAHFLLRMKCRGRFISTVAVGNFDSIHDTKYTHGDVENPIPANIEDSTKLFSVHCFPIMIFDAIIGDNSITSDKSRDKRSSTVVGRLSLVNIFNRSSVSAGSPLKGVTQKFVMMVCFHELSEIPTKEPVVPESEEMEMANDPQQKPVRRVSRKVIPNMRNGHHKT